MSRATVERKLVQEIETEYNEDRLRPVIKRSTVELIWGLADDASREDLTMERRQEIINLAVKQVDDEGGQEDRLKQIATYAIYVYDLPPKTLTGFVPRLMPRFRAEFVKLCNDRVIRRKQRS